MAREFRTLRGHVGTADCACTICASTAPTTAGNGVPAPPDMAAVIRESRTQGQPAKPNAPAVDKNQAPAPPDMVAIIRGGK